MQQTRQQILEILREQGESTVDDLVFALRERRGDKITAVTIRHHLNELLRQNLIETARLLHRSSPGRPQHVYSLTHQAQEHFPDNYRQLATHLLAHIRNNLPEDSVNVIMEGVAVDMAADAGITALPMADRLDQVVEYLNENGYNAEWKHDQQDFVLITRNCPYHELAQHTNVVCKMDLHLISAMLGVIPRMSTPHNEECNICFFRIPALKS